MSVDMYLPSFPMLARDLQTTTANVQLTLATFFIGLAVGQAIYGPLADRFGRKPPLYAGLALYCIASIGCALAPNIEVLIAMRLLQALGGCAGLVISRAMVRDLFDHQTAARVFSKLMLVMGVAPILAPLIGAQILGWVGWRGIFWCLTTFGLACLIASRWLPDSRIADPNARLALGPVIRGYTTLLNDRSFIGPALASSLAQSGMFAYITGSPFVFIELYHIPAESYGWVFGTNALGLIIASQLNARLLGRFSTEQLLSFACNSTAVLGVALGAAAALQLGGLIGILLPLFGYVASLGFIGPNATAIALKHQAHRAGAASALLGTVQFGIATVAGGAVGLFHDGTARTMAFTIAVCGVLSALCHWVSQPPKAQDRTER